MLAAMLGLCESPAEEAFVEGLFDWAEENSCRVCSPDGRTFLFSSGLTVSYSVTPQFHISLYRTDFLFIPKPGTPSPWHGYAVEIDGHAWHERTASEAAAQRDRDRHFIALHYLPIRFAAIEVFSDAEGCVTAVEFLIEDRFNRDGWFAEDSAAL